MLKIAENLYAVQGMASGLATPGWSTKADMAPYDRARPSAHNIGLNTAWMCAQDRSKWCQLVETAMLTDRRATRL